ncbi:MAG: heavy metal-associated domain-containing protein [Bacteroidota bacterium]|nr:heavy metal-associated domain-containing protein [Bacteroidota bacterium]
MENNAIQFKTNLNCEGCVAKVQADLDKIVGAEKWHVDTANPLKILSVSSDADVQKIVEIVKSKGFVIDSIDK